MVDLICDLPICDPVFISPSFLLMHQHCLYDSTTGSGTTSYPPPKPWHKIKEAEEGEIQEVDEFEGIKSDGRGAYINEEDQKRYLNEELKEWKIETIESYYNVGEPSYPDMPSLTPEQVCAGGVDTSYCHGRYLMQL